MNARASLAAALAFAAPAAQAQPTGEPTFELTLVSLTGEHEVVGTLPDTVFAPRVSPDGTHIAFENVDFSKGAANVTVANLRALDDRYELPLYDGSMNWAPSWSPDGERILFIASGPPLDEVSRGFRAGEPGSGPGGAETPRRRCQRGQGVRRAIGHRPATVADLVATAQACLFH
jgi:hypothetical protein